MVVGYSANTMSSVLEVLGLSLPYSASTPATYAEKVQECVKAAGYLKRLLELDLKPKCVYRIADCVWVLILPMRPAGIS